MNTTKKNNSVLYAMLSIALMIGSGFLLFLTINRMYGVSSAFATLSLSLLAIFLFVAGASLMRIINPKEKLNYSFNEKDGGIQIALLLIAAGSLLLCFNTELLNPVWKSFFFSWPMLVFVIGALCICKSHLIFGLIVAACSIFFMIDKAAVIYPNEMVIEQLTANFWPAIFIISGVVIFIYIITKPKSYLNWHCKGNWKENYAAEENENKDGKINYRFVFSGTEQVILDPVFKGGTIETTFGGMELDLRRTTLAEGNTYLYINTTFGGVDIMAPDTWDIELKSHSFAGGVTDSRIKHLEIDRTRKLIIVAKSTFGGITIR